MEVPARDAIASIDRTAVERELKKLKKQLREIAKIQGRIDAGEKVEKLQIVKAEQEEVVRNRLAELEGLQAVEIAEAAVLKAEQEDVVRKQLAEAEVLKKGLLWIRDPNFCKLNRPEQLRCIQGADNVKTTLGLQPTSAPKYIVAHCGKTRLQYRCAAGLVQVLQHGPRVTVNLAAALMSSRPVEDQMVEVLSTLSNLPKEDVKGKQSPQEWIVSKAKDPIWDVDANEKTPVGAFRAYAAPCKGDETKPYQLSVHHWGGFDLSKGYFLLRPSDSEPIQPPDGVDFKHFEYMGFGAAGYDSEEQHVICCKESENFIDPEPGKDQNAPFGWVQVFLKVSREFGGPPVEVYLNFHLCHGDARPKVPLLQKQVPKLSDITRKYIADLMQILRRI